MAFKVGDVVELKSGGPNMTVDSIDSSGKVWCTWQVSSATDVKTDRHNFHVDMLKEVKPAAGW